MGGRKGEGGGNKMMREEREGEQYNHSNQCHSYYNPSQTSSPTRHGGHSDAGSCEKV